MGTRFHAVVSLLRIFHFFPERQTVWYWFEFHGLFSRHLNPSWHPKSTAGNPNTIRNSSKATAGIQHELQNKWSERIPQRGRRSLEEDIRGELLDIFLFGQLSLIRQTIYLVSLCNFICSCQKSHIHLRQKDLSFLRLWTQILADVQQTRAEQRCPGRRSLLKVCNNSSKRSDAAMPPVKLKCADFFQPRPSPVNPPPVRPRSPSTRRPPRWERKSCTKSTTHPWWAVICPVLFYREGFWKLKTHVPYALWYKKSEGTRDVHLDDWAHKHTRMHRGFSAAVVCFVR